MREAMEGSAALELSRPVKTRHGQWAPRLLELSLEPGPPPPRSVPTDPTRPEVSSKHAEYTEHTEYASNWPLKAVYDRGGTTTLESMCFSQRSTQRRGLLSRLDRRAGCRIAGIVRGLERVAGC